MTCGLSRPSICGSQQSNVAPKPVGVYHTMPKRTVPDDREACCVLQMPRSKVLLVQALLMVMNSLR